VTIMDMDKVSLGFVPTHRVPFSEQWAVEMRHRCIAAMEHVQGIDLVVPTEAETLNGLVRDDRDAAKAIESFKSRGVAGIIIGAMTFGDEIAAVTIAETLKPLPVFLFGTKEPDFTADGRRLSDSFCGTLSISTGLTRRKIPFVFGDVVFPEEASFHQQIEDFARASAAISKFRGARFGLVGPRPERFETCAFNEIALAEKFAQRVVPISLVDVFRAARAISDEDPALIKTLQEVTTQADVGGMSRDALIRSAKLEVALLQFAEKKSLAGMGIQCWTAMQEEYGISSCLAMGRLTDRGIMASCEVDILGALTMQLQYEASFKQTVPHFIDWTIAHQHKENVFLAWHCGNAPLSLACSDCRPRVAAHSIFDVLLSAEQSQGATDAQLRSGPVTLSRLVEYDGVFKMLLTRGEVIPSSERLRGSWSWVEVGDLKRLYRTLVEEGFLHHASLIHGDQREALKTACKFLGVDVVAV
jgi:L-fucose isomerase-like protein